MLSPSAIFERVGAPLHNIMWSWGAMRADGTVFLRAWQDETRDVDGLRYVRLVNHGAYQTDGDNLGYRERLTHLAALHAGGTGYVIICRAKDTSAQPRSIASVNGQDAFRLGAIKLIDGDEWGEFADRIPLRNLMRN